MHFPLEFLFSECIIWYVYSTPLLSEKDGGQIIISGLDSKYFLENYE